MRPGLLRIVFCDFRVLTDVPRTVILYPENARFAWGDFRISEICDDLLHVSGGRCDRRGHVFYMEISGTDPGGRSALLAFHANI